MPIESSAKYLGAQNEISARIQARDRVMLAFTSLTSALVGFALSNNDMAFVALGIGYMSLVSSLVYFQHELAIACLAQFQRDLGTYLKEKDKDEADNNSPNWWDGKYKKDRSGFRRFRIGGYLLVIALGDTASLWIARKGLAYSAQNYEMKIITWWGSLCCSVIAFLLVVWAVTKRKNLYTQF